MQKLYSRSLLICSGGQEFALFLKSKLAQRFKIMPRYETKIVKVKYTLKVSHREITYLN